MQMNILNANALDYTSACGRVAAERGGSEASTTIASVTTIRSSCINGARRQDKPQVMKSSERIGRNKWKTLRVQDKNKAARQQKKRITDNRTRSNDCHSNWNCSYANNNESKNGNQIIINSTKLSLHDVRTSRRTTIIGLLLYYYCYLLLFAHLPAATRAHCRDEESRECEAICTRIGRVENNTRNCTIRALVLLPDDDMYVASLSRVLPILKVAEQQIRSHALVPPYIDFEWLARNEKCDASLAMIKAMDGITKNCAHVIFGPVCDYSLAAVSRITKYFNSQGTPLISVGGSTYDFEQKKTTCNDEFYMLLRTGMLSFETLSELTINVMKRHNWSHSIFYYERDGQKSVAGMHTCFLMMKSLGKQMRKENMTFAQYPLDPKLINRTEEMKREIGNKHSIVIMCADPQSIRQIMLTAEQLNMIDSGEYVFINIELFSRVPYLTSQPWYDKNDTALNNERARKAYTAMLTVTPKQPNDDAYTRVSNDIKAIAAAKYNYTFSDNEPISAFVTSFFDGVLLYANALNDSIREDPTMLDRPLNGTDMVRRMWNRSFTGITGNVTIDANGDRISAYSLLDMNPVTGRFEIVAHFLHNRLDYEPDKVIHWAGDREEAPPDMPTCGYDGALCPDNSLPGYAILSIVLGMIVIIMAVCFFFGYRHYKSEAEINSMTWKIAIDEVVFRDTAERYLRGSFHSLVKQNSQLTLMSEDMGSINGDRQIFIPVGMYRGCKVAIKAIDEESINLTRELMLELKRMKDLQHDHLVKFYGACLDTRRSFLLTEYCPKGSLQDILENEQFQLDWMFKLSLMHDIVRGMHFLHNSDIRSHGNLKSSNCVVDSRFVLKITDFGLHTLRRGARYDKESDVENCNSHAYWSQFLWTAPELLKMEHNRPPEGTQKGDIYSFAIIVHEITTRQGPFYLGKNEKSPQEIIELVKGYPDLTATPFRPEIEDVHNDTNSIMLRCWAEEPAERLDFTTLKTIIRKINKDNETGNIVDNLLKRMEMYANNLEELVEERTQDYNEEKKKCEKLLYQLLPQSVAAQLISGRPVVAETFDQVTIYFSDIVGFTAISAESTPMQVVQFLNDLYTCFDSIVENFDVYKVETIGDAYMVVSGLPIRNGNQHAREIARLALALLEAVHNFCIHHRPDDRLKLRIGLHTGACVAGVVGLKMPRYCLFGDTVNTASRMESNGEALKIHISETTKLALDEFGTFVTTRRGFVPMKGKGEMLTYWLEGEMHKQEEHLSPHKLMLTRRSSLRQPRSYAPLHKQAPELITLNALVAGLGHDRRLPQINLPSPASPSNDNGNVAFAIGADEEPPQQHEQQKLTPKLRVKRKISTSSPKLNGDFGGDYKTDDYNYYMDVYGGLGNGSGLIDKTKYKLQHCDIYSSRSLRESMPRSNDNWELANFRLPLSGALKSHNMHNMHNNHNNNNRHSYIQSNSNTNLSGILQPTTRLRLKQSPTISTLVTSGTDNGSICSGNRIKFAGEPLIETAINETTAPHNCSSKLPLLESNTNSPPMALTTNAASQQTHAVAPYSPTHKLSRHNTAAATLVSTSDNHHSFNNLIKANNVKNYTQLLCKTSSNSKMTLAEECPSVRSSGTGTGAGAGVGAVGVSNNAVTQPLLAKINS